MDTQCNVLGKLLVEDLEVVLLLGEELEHAFGDVIFHELDDPLRLQHFSGYVELQIVRVDNSLQEIAPLEMNSS
jgi:hypothetical protein